MENKKKPMGDPHFQSNLKFWLVVAAINVLILCFIFNLALEMS